MEKSSRAPGPSNRRRKISPPRTRMTGFCSGGMRSATSCVIMTSCVRALVRHQTYTEPRNCGCSVPPRRLTRSSGIPAATSRHDNLSIVRAKEWRCRAPPMSHSTIASIVSWAGRSATALSTTSVTMMLRPSTISDEDAVSPKRLAPRNSYEPYLQRCLRCRLSSYHLRRK